MSNISNKKNIPVGATRWVALEKAGAVHMRVFEHVDVVSTLLTLIIKRMQMDMLKRYMGTEKMGTRNMGTGSDFACHYLHAPIGFPSEIRACPHISASNSVFSRGDH